MTQEGIRTAREFAEACSVAYSRLTYIAAGYAGNRACAEDIVQQAFAIAIEKNQTFDNQDQFNAWLAGIVKNCALNDRRKTRRRKTWSTDPANFDRLTLTSSPETPVQTKGVLSPLQTDFDDRVVDALNQLSADARCCILLRTIERLSYKEISSLIQIPEGTAMNLVHRGKSKLRNLLIDLADSKKTSPADREQS